MRLTAPTAIREPEDLRFLSTAHRADDSLEIDLTDVEWISPLGVVAVLATCLRADRETLNATVYLPESREVRTYLAAIGLVAELDRTEWVRTKGRSTEDIASSQTELHAWRETEGLDIDPDLTFAPYLPVSRLTTMREVDLAADTLEDRMKEASHLRGGLSDELLTIAVELTANAREHGSACYAVAQAHSGRTSGTPGVHIAVADFGKGLAETLREPYGQMSDGEAIRHAFTERVSGTGRSDRGFGLTQIAEIVDRDPKSVLHIISQSGHVVRTDRQFEVTESEELLFSGTLATAYLPALSPIIDISGG